MKIKHVITIRCGNQMVTVPVDEDKRPGGLARMQKQAFTRAAIELSKIVDCRGRTLNLVTNWTK